MDMGTFTQLYFGAFSAMELWEAGRIKCSDVRKLQLLDELFPKCRTYNTEYFESLCRLSDVSAACFSTEKPMPYLT